MRYEVDFVTLLTVPAPVVPPPDQPPGPVPDIRPTGVVKTPSGGFSFTLPPSPGNLPKVVRALYLPPDFDKATPADAVFNVAAPKLDFEPDGTGEYGVDNPPADAAPGDYLLALVSGYEV